MGLLLREGEWIWERYIGDGNGGLEGRGRGQKAWEGRVYIPSMQNLANPALITICDVHTVNAYTV